jgi:ribosome-associated translation inhibitor RaiA
MLWQAKQGRQEAEQMHVQTNTDRHITGSEALAARVDAVVAGALGRFVDQITRVEVHLSDENGGKGGGDDKRCLMEARLEGRQPTAVTHQAATVEAAMDGAAEKLARAIESTLGRLRSS